MSPIGETFSGTPNVLTAYRKVNILLPWGRCSSIIDTLVVPVLKIAA
jgi:hypothetical protein